MDSSETTQRDDTLPLDLLIIIFRRYKHDLYQLHRMRRTCRAWREAIDITTRLLLCEMEWSVFIPIRCNGYRTARQIVAVLGQLEEVQSSHYERIDGTGGQVATALYDGLRGRKLRAKKSRGRLKIVWPTGTVIDIFSLPLICHDPVTFQLQACKKRNRPIEPNWSDRKVRRLLLGDYDLSRYNDCDSESELHIICRLSPHIEAVREDDDLISRQ